MSTLSIYMFDGSNCELCRHLPSHQLTAPLQILLFITQKQFLRET
jgi:hypothetical protein